MTVAFWFAHICISSGSTCKVDQLLITYYCSGLHEMKTKKNKDVVWRATIDMEDYRCLQCDNILNLVLLSNTATFSSANICCNICQRRQQEHNHTSSLLVKTFVCERHVPRSLARLRYHSSSTPRKTQLTVLFSALHLNVKLCIGFISF